MHEPIALETLQAGGPLSEDKRYIVRLADIELLAALRAGQLCYVLAPRQIGKSSLRIRTARLLRQDGLRCATLSLDQIASAQSEDQWYGTLISLLVRQLRLPEPQTPDHQVTPVARFRVFLRDHVLKHVQEPLVIFIDEVDTILSLGIRSDDFLASLRACDNDRAEDPTWNRLCFCLLGVAAPADLIADATRTPFNVGRGILLEDFSRQELEGFAPDVAGLGVSPEAILDAVQSWTAGQPYMTQRLCVELKKRGKISRSENLEASVASAVNELFLARGRTQDPQLSYAEQRLDSRPDAARLLQLYHQLLTASVDQALPSVRAEGGDRIQLELRLCGLAAERLGNGKKSGGFRLLCPRNKIFMQVFDVAWVEETLARRPITEAVRRWRVHGKTSEHLLRDSSLRNVLEWARAHPTNLTADDYEFLSQSQEKHQARRDRKIIIGLLVLVLALFVAAVLAFWLRNQAQEQTKRTKQLAEQNKRQSDELRREKDRAEYLVRQLSNQKAALEGEKNRVEHEKARAQNEEAHVKQEKAHVELVSEQLRRRSIELEQQKESAEEARQLALQAKKRAEQETQRALQETVRAEEEKNRAERGERIERSLRALMLAAQPERLLQALVLGMQAAQPELTEGYKDPRVWEGLVAAAQEASDTQVLTRGTPAFSASLRRMAVSGPNDRGIEVWDTQIGSLLSKVPGAQGIVQGVSDDGQRVLARRVYMRQGKLSECLTLWDIASGRPLLHLPDSIRIRLLRLSPNGQQFVTFGVSSPALLWDVQNIRHPQPLLPIGTELTIATYSPDGRRLLANGSDRTTGVWSTSTGALLRVLKEHEGMVKAAVFTSDGKYILVSDHDGQTGLWNAETGELVRKFEAQQGALQAVAISPDSQRFLLAGNDGTVSIFVTVDGSLVQTLRGHEGAIRAAIFSPDGLYVLTASTDGTVRRWPLQRSRLAKSLSLSEFSGAVIALTAGKRHLAVTGADNASAVWDADTGLRHIVLNGQGAEVAALSPDGKRLATARWHDYIKVWDLTDGRLIRRFDEIKTGFPALAYSPDGQHIVSLVDEHTLKVWNAHNGTLAVSIFDSRAHFTAVAYSSDNRRIVTGTLSGIVTVWDSTTANRLLTLSETAGLVTALACSTDNLYIVTGSGDHTARVWNAADGRLLHALRGHTAKVTDLAFSPNGKQVVTTSSDRNGKVWDLQSGKLMLTLHGHDDGLTKAAFSKSGDEIFTGDESGRVLIHPIPFSAYYRFACRLLLGIPEIREVSREDRAFLLRTCAVAP